MQSQLTKHQVKTVTKVYKEPYAKRAGKAVINLRYDDRCGNGHNTFSITVDIISSNGRKIGGGCQHDLIAQKWPSLAPLLKFHLVSSDGPIHYIANSKFWAECGNLTNFRSAAIWQDADLDDMNDPNLEQVLNDRLPKIMVDFQEAMIKLGFTY